MRARASLLFAISTLAASLLGCASPARAESSAVECVAQATRSQLLSSKEALELCSGLASTAPARCYNQARLTTHLSKADSLRLCRCSTGTEPVECYNEAVRDQLLDKTQAMQLCLYEGKDSETAQNCLLFGS